MEDFLDELCHQETGDFFSNGLPPFVVDVVKALFDQFGSRQDIKAMLIDLPRDSWDVRRFPCKDVPIAEQEVNELVLLLVGKDATDPNGFACVFGVDLYRIGVFSGLEGPRRLLPCARFKRNFGHGGMDSLQL